MQEHSCTPLKAVKAPAVHNAPLFAAGGLDYLAIS
jgi:hypothetical protein